MNISTVSFGAAAYKNGRTQNSQRTSYVQKQPAAKDQIELKRKAYIQKQKKRKFFDGIKTTITALAVAASIHSCNANKDNINAVEIPFDYNNTSISEIAEIYNSDEDIIFAYNNIDEDTNLSEIEEITVPMVYSSTQNKIDDLQNKLFSDNISDKKRSSIEEEIKELKEQKEIQDAVALSYTDGKYIYYKLNPSSEETSDEVQKIYSYGSINVETFKDLFNIKDGTLKKYNNLSFSFESNEYGGYKDYTRGHLSSGDIVKVPLSAIKD